MPTMFAIKHIDHVVLRVTNLQAMMDFYIDVLGCSLEKIQEEIGLYQLRAGSSLIDFVVAESTTGNEGRNLDHFCLRIDPFNSDEIRQHLRTKGIEAGNVESRYGADGTGPSIYLTDPEGNVVELKGPPVFGAADRNPKTEQTQ
jgi:catechol 2,3-dioxygenase-like lactoylglutathione lyase family enzyme